MTTLENIFGTGMTRSQKIKKSFLGGVNLGVYSSLKDVGLIGFQAARSGRGSLVPSIVGQSVAAATGIPLAGFASAAICLIPGIGPITAAIIGEALSGYAEFRFGSALIKKVRTFSELHKQMRHLEMGGNYKDTELAQRQRFIAIQDMNATMIPGRRYLGQEALLMHR
jgi:hypothetical protein